MEFLRGMYVVGLTDTTPTLSGRIERVEEGPPVTIHIESVPWSQLSDRHQKGERNERQANTILNRVYRGERVDAFGNTDPFHLADLIGIQAEYPTLLVQVKTNEFSAADRQYYRRWARGKIDNSHTVFEVWVREDRTGWTMHRYVLTGENRETGEFTSYYQTNTCNPSQVRDDWATAFEESLPPNRNGDSPSNI